MIWSRTTYPGIKFLGPFAKIWILLKIQGVDITLNIVQAFQECVFVIGAFVQVA